MTFSEVIEAFEAVDIDVRQAYWDGASPDGPRHLRDGSLYRPWLPPFDGEDLIDADKELVISIGGAEYRVVGVINEAQRIIVSCQPA